MKDDSGGKIIKEFVTLMNEGFVEKKEKAQESAIEREKKFQDYKVKVCLLREK